MFSYLLKIGVAHNARHFRCVFAVVTYREFREFENEHCKRSFTLRYILRNKLIVNILFPMFLNRLLI